ncbi:hypothetical protein [Pontibacter sp. HJ8]
MRKLRYWIRRHFGFSQREVNAFLVLIGLMVLLTAAPLLFKWLSRPDTDSFGSQSDRQVLDSLVADWRQSSHPPGRSGSLGYRLSLCGPSTPTT